MKLNKNFTLQAFENVFIKEMGYCRNGQYKEPCRVIVFVVCNRYLHIEFNHLGKYIHLAKLRFTTCTHGLRESKIKLMKTV